MNNFTDSFVCQSRKKCHHCRSAASWGIQFRTVFAQNHEMPGPGLFVCPFGVTAESLPAPVEVKREPVLCPRCGKAMEGGCRRSCPNCRFEEGCGQ